MTERNEDPVADIAWMRRLAEENAQAPMQGAPILMAAGLTFGTGSLAFWAELTGMFRVPGIFGVSWLAATALLTYAAVIVSFLGGIHWGLAMRQQRAPRGWLTWGVLPGLLAWAGLLLNSAWGLLLMAASLIVCYVVDAQIYRPLQLGGWMVLR